MAEQAGQQAGEQAPVGERRPGGALEALAALDLGETEPAVVFDARWGAE